MPVRRATRAAAVALLLCSSMAVASAGPAGAQAAGPAVTVSPTDDLMEGQPVTVSGTGHAPDSRVTISQCPPGVTSVDDCPDPDGFRDDPVVTDADGAFATEFAVSPVAPAPRFGNRGDTDCTEVVCSIAVEVTGPTQFVPISFADDPIPDGTITVTPPTGLLDDQLVEVTGTDFVPGSRFRIGNCLSGASTSGTEHCDSLHTVLVEPDASGSFTVDLRVERFIADNDCVEVACAVVSFAVRPLGIEAPLEFADVPPPVRTVEVLNNTGLVENGRAMVVGSGFRPDAALTARRCPAAPASDLDCDRGTSDIRTDGQGGFERVVGVSRVLRPASGGPALDCAVETCTIGVSNEPRPAVSGPLDIVDPGVSVELSPDATLLAGTNEVVARLTVSCEIATPVSVRATVSQTGIEGTYLLNDQMCAPDEPLLVFVPTYARNVDATDGAAFALGEAQFAASVSPTEHHVETDPPSVHTEAVGPIELLDQALITAAVQTAIADPANIRLRDEVQRALAIRVGQDREFRRTWRRPPPIDPAITVSPAVDLLEGQVVQVSGTGFQGGTTTSLGQCAPGSDIANDCDGSTRQRFSVDESGAFTIEMTVRRFLEEAEIDCADGGCTIGALHNPAIVASAPTAFLDVDFDEQLTASPTDDLVDGQPVTVSGTGYAPEVRVAVRQCGPGETRVGRCSNPNEVYPDTDTDGAFTAEIDVARFLVGPLGETIDCAAVACRIGVIGTRPAQFVPIGFADDPLPTGSVTVTPSADLLGDQVVEVRGTGFVPGAGLEFATCRSGTSDPLSADCEGQPVSVEPDAAGSFAVDLQVERYIDYDDCVEVACAVVGFTASNLALGIEVPLSFADVPPPARTIEVLTTDPVDGAPATIVGSGFEPNAPVEIRVCPADPARPDDCSPLLRGRFEADHSGEWDFELHFPRVIRPVNGPPIDCAVETCTIGATSEPFIPVSGPLDVLEPGLTIDLAPDATLLAGTNEVVARLTVSCEIATLVAVRAAVSQPGIEGTWERDRPRCTPDDPLLFFVPIRTFTTDDADYTLGDAQLTADVRPERGFSDVGENPPSLFTTASATIQIHDHDMIAAAVQAAIADPANAELRDEVLRAILVRLGQDPVFRAEWEARSTPD